MNYMIIMRKLLIVISVYVILITPFLAICLSVYPTLFIQVLSLITLAVSYYLQAIKEQYKYLILYCLCLMVLYLIVFQCPYRIQLNFLISMYGIILGYIGYHLFSKDGEFVIQNTAPIKFINLIWSGIFLIYIAYPYVESRFIIFKTYGTFNDVTFVNSNNLVVLLNVLYVLIIIVAILIDRKGLGTIEFIKNIIFYLYFVNILMVLIPMLRIGIWIYF